MGQFIISSLIFNYETIFSENYELNDSWTAVYYIVIAKECLQNLRD